MVTHTLAIHYDREADPAYIYVVPPGPDRSIVRSSVADVQLDRAAITLDFMEDDVIAGIEILGASRVLPPDILTDTAERGPT